MYGGVVSRVSAAMMWGWGVRFVPHRPHITVPRWRRLASIDLSTVDVRRMDLPDSDFADDRPATTRGRTLVDCGRALPFIDSLPIFNDALRQGFPSPELAALARSARGPGSVALRRVASVASARPKNAFESVLWAICLGVPGLQVEPQVAAGNELCFLGTPDLVDRRLAIAIEADSFEWHGGRDQLVSDAQRYNAFTVAGWQVLKFPWEDVMLHPDDVHRVLAEAVSRRMLSNRG